MANKGDKVFLREKPQFFQPAGSPINGFYRNGAVPNDTIVSDWITDNYDDCVFLGEIQEINKKKYYLVKLNFTYRQHGFLGIGKDVKDSEDIWFLEDDFSFERIVTDADKEQAKKEALKKQILEGVDNIPVASNQSSGGSSTIIIIVLSAISVLAGVLWWAFGKKKGGSASMPVAPTIIQLPKNQTQQPKQIQA